MKVSSPKPLEKQPRFPSITAEAASSSRCLLLMSSRIRRVQTSSLSVWGRQIQTASSVLSPSGSLGELSAELLPALWAALLPGGASARENRIIASRVVHAEPSLTHPGVAFTVLCPSILPLTNTQFSTLTFSTVSKEPVSFFCFCGLCCFGGRVTS